MIQSMTGFGKAEFNSKNANFTIEVKSLNSKHIDVNCRKCPPFIEIKDIDLGNQSLKNYKEEKSRYQYGEKNQNH